MTPTPIPTIIAPLTTTNQLINTDFWTIFFAALATIIAGVSLFLSLKNYHETVSSKYNGSVYPVGKISLTWWRESPCIVAEIIFTNSGAKSGYVEDLILRINDPSDSGMQTPFKPVMKAVSKEFDLLSAEDNPHQELEDFSSVWLNGKESEKQTIFFLPNSGSFNIRNPTSINESIAYISFNPKESSKAKWVFSKINFTYTISASNIDDWKNQRKTVTLDSNQTIRARTSFFSSN